MIIYPAIDLKSGKCVRLLQGNFDQDTCYSHDPVAVARQYAKEKPEFLHIVDLDGAAKGFFSQHDLIIQLQRESGLKIQVGGGIRTKQDIDILFSYGVTRVILGSIAITMPKLVNHWLDEFGSDKIVLAFDVKINSQGDPMVATEGWSTLSNKTLWNVLDFYQAQGVKNVLCTDIDRDGTLQGPNITLYKDCQKRYPQIAFQASGGIHALNDLQLLKNIPMAGAIVGKALYEKCFSLAEAIEAGQ